MMRWITLFALLVAFSVVDADTSSPRATIEEYIEACRVGDASRLQAIFHDDAVMSGYYAGEFFLGTPESFFDEVRDNPSPAVTGNPYAAQIALVNIAEQTASVVMQEQGYFGDDYTNMFHLAEIDGQWMIISKIYQQLESAE